MVSSPWRLGLAGWRFAVYEVVTYDDAVDDVTVFMLIRVYPLNDSGVMLHSIKPEL